MGDASLIVKDRLVKGYANQTQQNSFINLIDNINLI
jgi:hypothetical protein